MLKKPDKRCKGINFAYIIEDEAENIDSTSSYFS
jgi:hypothetical protein